MIDSDQTELARLRVLEAIYVVTRDHKAGFSKTPNGVFRFVRAQLYRVKRDSEPGAASTYVYESVTTRRDLVTLIYQNHLRVAHTGFVELRSSSVPNDLVTRDGDEHQYKKDHYL